MDYQKAIELLENANRRNEIVGILPKSDVSKAIISSMKELREYKQLGTMKEICEAVEKQKAKKPYLSGDGYFDGKLVYDTYECPNCGKKYEIDYEEHDYCPNCGQHIDWSEEDD